MAFALLLRPLSLASSKKFNSRAATPIRRLAAASAPGAALATAFAAENPRVCQGTPGARLCLRLLGSNVHI
jgi:hypothetical protein